MAEDNQTVTILLEQFNHMCDELLELREYKKNSINMLDKIREEIEEIHLIGYATVDGKTEIASRAVMQIIDKYSEGGAE